MKKVMETMKIREIKSKKNISKFSMTEKTVKRINNEEGD
jgi:hypothetical protein